MADPKAKVIIDADGADVIKEAKKITKAMQGLGHDVRDSFQRGMADSGRLLTDLSERAGQVFGVLKNPLVLATTGIAALGAAAYKVGQAAVNMGGAFDKSMANVSTLLDTSQVNMEGLGKHVLQTALDFRRSPALVADALYEWISANGRIDDGLADFRESVKASVAGVTEAKTAVDGITTIMNSYGKEAGGAARVSDLMFQTVNKGKINFTELASQIGLVISTAKGASVPLTDLMAAIATATAQGVRPSSAMEGLRSAISNIIKPSDDAKTTAKLLGIQWGAAALKAKGLAGLLKEVREKTKGNVETMTQLFGDVSGLSVALALTGEGAGMFADNLAIMEEAGGSTDEAFRKQRKTWEEVAAGLVTLGQVAATEIFNKFKPYLMEAGQWVLDNWPNVRAQLQQTASDLSGIVSLGLTPFKLAWDAAIGAISTVSALLQGDIPGATSAAKVALDELKGTLAEFKTTWEGIQVPGWVKVLGEVAVTLVSLRLGLSAAKVVLQGLAMALGALEGVLNALAAGSLIKLIGQLTGTGGLAKAFTTVVDKGAFVILALGKVLDGVVAVGAGVLRFLGPWGLLAAAAVTAATLIITNWDKVGPFLASVWESIKSAAATAWENITGGVRSAWEAIKTAVANGVDAVKTFFTETIPKWYDAFKTWMSDTLTGIGNWFAELPGKLAEKVGFVAGWLSVKIPEWWKAFSTWLENTWKGISTWFAELPGKIAGAVVGTVTWLTTNVPKWTEAFTTWLENTWKGITTWFTELPGKLVSFVTNVGTWLATEIPRLWNAFTTWKNGVLSDLQTWFEELPGKFTTWLTNVANSISGLWSVFLEKGRQLGLQVWAGLKSSVTGAITGAVDSAKTLLDSLKKGFRSGREAAGGTDEEIPQFGVGGIVRQRMLAVVGEAGTEAIVPKSDAASWLPLIAQWAGLATTAVAPSLPALAGVAGATGGTNINFGGINVILSAPPGTENPRAWGAAAGDALFQRLASMIKL